MPVRSTLSLQTTTFITVVVGTVPTVFIQSGHVWPQAQWTCHQLTLSSARHFSSTVCIGPSKLCRLPLCHEKIGRPHISTRRIRQSGRWAEVCGGGVSVQNPDHYGDEDGEMIVRFGRFIRNMCYEEESSYPMATSAWQSPGKHAPGKHCSFCYKSSCWVDKEIASPCSLD